MQSNAPVKSSHLINKMWVVLVLTVLINSKLFKSAMLYAMVLWAAYNTNFFEKLHVHYSHYSIKL